MLGRVRKPRRRKDADASGLQLWCITRHPDRIRTKRLAEKQCLCDIRHWQIYDRIARYAETFCVVGIAPEAGADFQNLSIWKLSCQISYTPRLIDRMGRPVPCDSTPGRQAPLARKRIREVNFESEPLIDRLQQDLNALRA